MSMEAIKFNRVWPRPIVQSPVKRSDDRATVKVR
jgi:hypothetical protein